MLHFLISYFSVKQDDSYLESYISTIGVDFVSIPHPPLNIISMLFSTQM
jgi:hypothetical protein